VIHLARLAIRRPLIALLCTLVVGGGLSLVALGIEDSLSPSITTVPGTESSHAADLSESEFGPSTLVPVLLEGPKAELNRQGPALVRALSERSDTRVMSAWDAGEVGASLRPRDTAAMIVAAVAKDEETMVKSTQAEIDAVVARQISGPVKASITGQPSIDRAMRDQAIDDTRTSVAWTLPILFVVLTLLLRAPVAAALITVLGAGTAFAGLGLTALAGKVTDVDALTALLGTMTGLVLGVGYGFFFFRRWRSLMRADGDHEAAAQAAIGSVASTGRAVLIGGTALVAANLVANALGPTEVLTSLFLTPTICALLAIGAAVVVMPAALVLLGRRTLALEFGAPAVVRRPWNWLAGEGGAFVIRDAVVVGAFATVLLVVLAIPVFSIETGPPSARYLPEDNAARVSFERVATVMGPGWPTPYNVVVVSETKPITDKALLKSMSDYQAKLAKDPRIDSVVGPGEIASTSEKLEALPKQLEGSAKTLKSSKKNLTKLEGGLGQAAAGVSQLQSGLKEAAGGSGQAQSGAGQLRGGLDQARDGASKISAGLASALDGARKLRDGSAAALTGSKQISGGLGQAVEPVKAGAPIVKKMAADVGASSAAVNGARDNAQALSAQLDDAAAKVQAMPESAEKTAALGAIAAARQGSGGLSSTLASTSNTLAGASGVAGAFSTQVQELSSGLAQLYAGSTALTNGIGELKTGNAQLADGIDQLSSGGGQLTTGITKLRNGAGELERGLGELSTGLAGGVGPSGQLVTGLSGGASDVAKFRKNLPSAKDIEQLQKESPGLFDSGYFVLAAIAGAPAEQRNQASFLVNLPRGGSAGQITVISKFAAEDPRSQELGEDLSDSVAAFAKSTNTEAALGGPAGALGDFRSEAASRIWPVIIGVSVAIALLLMAMLRTVVLPAVAVAFDLLTAAATFGILTLLFSGDDPLLGGPGYLDPVSIIAAFVSLFTMTLVYEVQLLSRTRDAFMATGDPHGALRSGLNQTAAATTGAAIAMLAAIAPFVFVTDLVAAEQLAIGSAIVIVLDAFIVRPVLMPAAVAVLGRWSWWPTSRKAPHPPSAGEPGPAVTAPTITPAPAGSGS
jgi:RND superfamily putative drug exporter